MLGIFVWITYVEKRDYWRLQYVLQCVIAYVNYKKNIETGPLLVIIMHRLIKSTKLNKEIKSRGTQEHPDRSDSEKFVT